MIAIIDKQSACIHGNPGIKSSSYIDVTSFMQSTPGEFNLVKVGRSTASKWVGPFFWVKL